MDETNVWLKCPVCENKTRVKIRQDTVLVNFPLYCPKCKKETIISANQLNVSVEKTEVINNEYNSYQ